MFARSSFALLIVSSVLLMGPFRMTAQADPAEGRPVSAGPLGRYSGSDARPSQPDSHAERAKTSSGSTQPQSNPRASEPSPGATPAEDPATTDNGYLPLYFDLATVLLSVGALLAFRRPRRR